MPSAASYNQEPSRGFALPHHAAIRILAVLAAAALVEVAGISVPTGKLTPITPAKVTPRPTYHPPSANPAPVHEYTYDNPEPAPLNPSWVPVPVKYLNILRPNSIFYVPIRIPNPAARDYYRLPLKEQSKTTEQTGSTYQEENNSVYQTQQPNVAVYQAQPHQQNAAVYQAQAQQPTPAVYQTQPQQQNAAVYQAQPQQPTPAVYEAQPQQPNVGVYQSQQQNAASYQTQQPTVAVYQQPTAQVYQTQQPTVAQQQPAESPVNQSQQPSVTTYPTQQPNTGSETAKDTTSYQKETAQTPEFGAKISPKQKWKPTYYLPKGQYKQATKGGYPKKAVAAASSEKYYYYYPIVTNAQ